MSSPRSGLILLHLSSRHAHLPEYLAELGFDIAQLQWGLNGHAPQVVVSDQPGLLDRETPLYDRVRSGQAGLVLINGSSLVQLEDELRADIVLPDDATGREVAMAVQLVGEITVQRRRLAHEREECERWIDLALHDPLTGLPNRRCWDRRLAQSLAAQTPLCIALIDVDFFKHVNDRDGYCVGDTVLREAARIMRSELRYGDFVARMGGDEFALILHRVDAAQAAAVLDRMRQTVSAELASKHLPAPTLSAGFVVLDGATPWDAADAVAAAATSLQSAKQQHRNRTVAYSPSFSSSGAANR